MKCPVCRAAVKETDQECACGELLTSWAKVRRHDHALRQHGLRRAAAGDHLGALVAFLEVALTSPLDGTCLVDAARALVHLGRAEDALRVLGHAGPRSASAAQALAGAIRSQAASAPAAPDPAE